MKTILVLAALLCACDVARVDHTANRGAVPNALQSQAEGCFEVEDETSTIKTAAACRATDDTVCSFAVELEDGTIGCCTTTQVDTSRVDGWTESWHTCEAP